MATDKKLNRAVKSLEKKTKTVHQKLVERVNVLLQEVKHVLPIDLKKVPNGQCTTDEVFELEDGNNIVQLNEEDYDAQHPRSLDVNYVPYDALAVSDLKEVVRILEDVSADCYKTMKRCEN